MFSTLNISVRLYLIFYNCYWSADPHTEQHWDAIGPNFLFLARDYFSRLSLNFSIIGRLQDTTGDYRRLQESTCMFCLKLFLKINVVLRFKINTFNVIFTLYVQAIVGGCACFWGSILGIKTQDFEILIHGLLSSGMGMCYGIVVLLKRSFEPQEIAKEEDQKIRSVSIVWLALLFVFNEKRIFCIFLFSL